MSESNNTATGADRAASVVGLVDTLAQSRLRGFVAILIVALVTFLPGLKLIPPLDRDEPSYVLETKMLLEAGQEGGGETSGILSYLEPRGAYWLQLAFVQLVGDGAASPIWVYRLPSLAAALSVALLTWWMALAFGRPRAALFAAFLVATTPLLVAEAHLAKPDALLLAGIVLALGALARLWQNQSEAPDYRNALFFWTGLAVGIVAKGLIAPVIIGLTVAVLHVVNRSSGLPARLVPIAGGLWLAFLVVTACWVGGLVTEAELDAQLLPARISVQEVYEAPPGSYAVLFYPLFGPAGVFVALAIPSVVERIRRPVFLFAFASVAPFWLLVELWPQKLPHFILPTFPALALVGATAIDDGWLRATGWISTYFSLNLLIWPALVAIGATVLFFAGEDNFPFLALPFFAAAIAAGIIAFFWFYRGRSVAGAAALSVLSAILVYIGLFGVVLSDATSLKISGRLAGAAQNAVTCSKPELAATGFAEPSLIFYAGTHIRLVSPEEAADFLAEGGCRVVFVERRRQSIFNQQVEDLGLDLNVREEIRGFNVGNWKRVKIRVFAVESSWP